MRFLENICAMSVFGHVIKTETLLNILLRIIEKKARDFQTIRFSKEDGCAGINRFFKNRHL